MFQEHIEGNMQKSSKSELKQQKAIQSSYAQSPDLWVISWSLYWSVVSLLFSYLQVISC